MAVDDHARIGFSDMYPDERTGSAVQFLRNAVAYYRSLGVRIKAVLTDNGSAFRSRDFNRLCAELGLKHRYTRAYRPQTNGKAERFIQSALREWAYGFTYQHSTQRTDALEAGAVPVRSPCAAAPGSLSRGRAEGRMPESIIARSGAHAGRLVGSEGHGRRRDSAEDRSQELVRGHVLGQGLE